MRIEEYPYTCAAHQALDWMADNQYMDAGVPICNFKDGSQYVMFYIGDQVDSSTVRNCKCRMGIYRRDAS